MALSRLQILKFVGFTVGLAAKFVTGSIFVFNVYQDVLKTSFNYTQTEVELLASMMNIGLGVGFLPGMFYDRFGPTLTSGAGLVVSVPAYLLIWSSMKYPSFYSKNVWLMSIYFLLAGFGSVFTYMVALNTNVINFSAKHTGKIVGFLNAFFAGSPSVFATIYYNIFTTGDSTLAENQDFKGFMLLLAILYAVVNVICMFFLRIYKDPVDHEDIEITMYKDTSGIAVDELTVAVDGKKYHTDIGTEQMSKLDNTEGVDSNPMTFKQLLCCLDFHLFVWMFAFAASVGLVYGNNLTVLSKSVYLDRYNSTLVIIIPISNAIISALIGIISDVFKNRVPRLAIVVGACCFFIAAQVLVILSATKLTVFVMATILAGLGIGVVWSLCPTIMKEMFSVNHLGRNWGIALLLAALVGFASQEVFGKLYDSHVPEEETNECYGMECIREGYGVFLAVSGLSLVLGLCILVRKRCCGKESS